jgi:tRNA/tmRNA/rRNA uracil-C5-methylase (TrmA/RlmC/RlmD family)
MVPRRLRGGARAEVKTQVVVELDRDAGLLRGGCPCALDRDAPEEEGDHRLRLRTHKRNWDDLGTLDAYWAVLTRPEARYGHWDPAEFFQTAVPEVARVLETADRLGVVRPHECMLDFGCGVGRLTRAFSPHFQRCYGVDVSSSMIARAQ